jgi:hypothetical protein
MQITISEEKTKEFLKEILVELIESKQELFYEIVTEALEDIGLGKAIAESRNDEFVSEEEIFTILKPLQSDRLNYR